MNINDFDIQIDHINHLRNDNRKSQLRLVNNSQNKMNTKIPKSNKSGVKGVIWHKRDNIWESHITINKIQIYLGRYDDFNEAVKARKQAEEKYFKNYNYKGEINGQVWKKE